MVDGVVGGGWFWGCYWLKSAPARQQLDLFSYPLTLSDGAGTALQLSYCLHLQSNDGNYHLPP